MFRLKCRAVMVRKKADAARRQSGKMPEYKRMDMLPMGIKKVNYEKT